MVTMLLKQFRQSARDQDTSYFSSQNAGHERRKEEVATEERKGASASGAIRYQKSVWLTSRA